MYKTRFCANCGGTCPCGRLLQVVALGDLELINDAFPGEPLPPPMREAWERLVAELGAVKVQRR